jgi:hypothetical protein
MFIALDSIVQEAHQKTNQNQISRSKHLSLPLVQRRKIPWEN